jgi:hypothetical protein
MFCSLFLFVTCHQPSCIWQLAIPLDPRQPSPITNPAIFLHIRLNNWIQDPSQLLLYDQRRQKQERLKQGLNNTRNPLQRHDCNIRRHRNPVEQNPKAVSRPTKEHALITVIAFVQVS